MKRFILVALVLLISTQAHAAGSWVHQRLVYLTPTTQVLIFECKGDSVTGAISDTTVTDAIMDKIKGWYVVNVEAFPGGTAPDEASVIIRDSVTGADFINGAGATLIQAATSKSTYSQTTDGLPFKMIVNAIILDVDNQATASALYTIYVTIGK